MAHIDINAVNIRAASFRGDLRLIERTGRWGPYVSIQDKFGIIEVANSMIEANLRIQGIIMGQEVTDDFIMDDEIPSADEMAWSQR